MLTNNEKQIILSLCQYNTNVSKVAREIGYTSQGLIYHLQKIKKKTGLEPRRFYDLVKLRRMIQDDRTKNACNS